MEVIITVGDVEKAVQDTADEHMGEKGVCAVCNDVVDVANGSRGLREFVHQLVVQSGIVGVLAPEHIRLAFIMGLTLGVRIQNAAQERINRSVDDILKGDPNG